MPIHPALQAMLDKAANLPPMHTVPLEAIRATDLKRYDIGVPKDEVASVEDRTIPGPRGGIRIRIYRPDLEDGRPVTVFFHGSGFCICSIDTHDAMCRQICNRGGTIIVSVDYALAPENPFPAGPDDAYAAVLWTAAHAASFGGDPARLGVCGDSAGGTMAAVSALRARDENGPAIKAQMLLYPVTDHYTGGHASFEERGAGFGLTANGMRWFWDFYLPSTDQAGHPHVSPYRAASLAGLPKCYLITAEYDLLRDEGEAFGQRLREAGVPVDHHRYADMNHGFLNWVGLFDRPTEAMDALAAWIRRQL
jgi:acetyl esterase